MTAVTQNFSSQVALCTEPSPHIERLFDVEAEQRVVTALQDLVRQHGWRTLARTYGWPVQQHASNDGDPTRAAAIDPWPAGSQPQSQHDSSP